MPTVARIETWKGTDVLDSGGNKAGRLDEVYYLSASEDPVLLAVKHGVLGRQVTLVPVTDAVLTHDSVQVPYTAEQMDNVHSGRVEDELTSEQVAAVAALFKVQLPSGPLHSASLIERRRSEAETAARRAHELELDAEQRARELAEARERASAAVEDANVAEQERREAEAASTEVTDPSPNST